MQNYSQVHQDLIVLKYLENKKNGYFLDIGCGYPKHINNTFLLEKEYDWNGISIDLVNFIEENGETWDSCRKSLHVLNDALMVDYSKLLKENNAPKNIDYLTMDLEPPDLTFECLFKVPFDEYTFNFISFEIDDGRECRHMERKPVSREFLKSKGYIFLGNIVGQDDIYIHENIKHRMDDVDFFETLIERGVPEHITKIFN